MLMNFDFSTTFTLMIYGKDKDQLCGKKQLTIRRKNHDYSR